MGRLYSEAHTEKEDTPMKVTIDITEKHMYAIEDMFFCDNTELEYDDMRPLLLEIWMRLCWSMYGVDD